jgi:hypothetical protein
LLRNSATLNLKVDNYLLKEIQIQMKRLFLSTILSLAVFLPNTVAVAEITMPHWDVTGNYVWTVLGTYVHDITITNQAADGTFVGVGGWPSGSLYQTTETITGSVVGDQITLTTTYDGPYAAGSTFTIHGTIGPDGTITDNHVDLWPWTLSGHANTTAIEGWGTELSAASCTGKIGNPVVNVTEKVIGDVDSGISGNYWANDVYTRHIQVWRVGSKGSQDYCALVTYDGTATAIEKEIGPGGSGSIGSGVAALMKGGRRALISGSLLPVPRWPTRGSVGTVDYKCDTTGYCASPVSWVEQYFAPGNTYSDAWWGWFYEAGSHGSWLNSSQGNWGNIL